MNENDIYSSRHIHENQKLKPFKSAYGRWITEKAIEKGFVEKREGGYYVNHDDKIILTKFVDTVIESPRLARIKKTVSLDDLITEIEKLKAQFKVVCNIAKKLKDR